VRLAAARFLSNCVTTNPSMAMSIVSSVCRTRYKRSSRSLQTSNFATRSTRNGESQTHRPSDSFRHSFRHSRGKKIARAPSASALRMRRGRGQTSRHARWSLRGGAAEARSSRRAGAAWCVSLACRSPQNSPRWGRARLGDDAACGQNEIPRKATTDSARSTRPRLTSPPSPPRPAPLKP
jgi:hypothetical protein